MPFFVVALKKEELIQWSCVCGGQNQTDAMMEAYYQWAGHERMDEQLEEAGGCNELSEQLLAEMFDCTEINREMVLEYVKQRLNGVNNICVHL